MDVEVVSLLELGLQVLVNDVHADNCQKNPPAFNPKSHIPSRVQLSFWIYKEPIPYF